MALSREVEGRALRNPATGLYSVSGANSRRRLIILGDKGVVYVNLL